MSAAVTGKKDRVGKNRVGIMMNNVKRAYFYAKATRVIYVEVCEEDKEEGEGDMIGQLELSVYGTRDAAQNWGRTKEEALVDIGFRVDCRTHVCYTMKAGR